MESSDNFLNQKIIYKEVRELEENLKKTSQEFEQAYIQLKRVFDENQGLIEQINTLNRQISILKDQIKSLNEENKTLKNELLKYFKIDNSLTASELQEYENRIETLTKKVKILKELMIEQSVGSTSGMAMQASLTNNFDFSEEANSGNSAHVKSTNSPECPSCLEKKPITYTFPCGHKCICAECAQDACQCLQCGKISTAKK